MEGVRGPSAARVRPYDGPRDSGGSRLLADRTFPSPHGPGRPAEWCYRGFRLLWRVAPRRSSARAVGARPVALTAATAKPQRPCRDVGGRLVTGTDGVFAVIVTHSDVERAG